MAAKNIVLKRKIQNDLYEMMPKTVGDQVSVTYGTQVQTLTTALASVYGSVEEWNTFKAGVDFAGQDAALDTLRELIDMISKEDVATSIAGQLKDIKAQIAVVNAKDTEQDGKIKDNADAIDGLKTRMTAVEGKASDNADAIAANDTAIKANDAAIKANAAAITALQEKDTQLDAKDEELAGKIDVNEKAIASIKTVQAGLSRVLFVATDGQVPDDLTENDLLLQEV